MATQLIIVSFVYIIVKWEMNVKGTTFENKAYLRTRKISNCKVKSYESFYGNFT